MVDANITSYLNSVIFCLMAKCISLFIIALVLFIPNCPYKYFLLTLELGLMVIISVSLFAISQNNKDSEKTLQNFLSTPPDVTTCPDYFVQSSDGVNTTCLNKFTTADAKLTYTFGSQNINLADIVPNDKTKIADVCNTIKQYTNIGWSDLRGQCEVLG